MKKKSLPVFFVGLLMCGCQMKEVINEYNVVPLPVTMSEQQGRFYLNSDVPIVVNASQEVKHIASGLSTTLLDIAGLKLKPTDELHENVPSIVFDSIPGMEKEAYKLSVTPQLIKITARRLTAFTMDYRPCINCCRWMSIVKKEHVMPNGVYLALK